jgi:hypothetical protein
LIFHSCFAPLFVASRKSVGATLHVRSTPREMVLARRIFIPASVFDGYAEIILNAV